MLFKEIYTDLNQKIDSNQYAAGSSLPSETELQQIYSVSRTTIRKAINLLVSDHKVIRKHGSGLFVAPAVSKQNILDMTGIIKSTYLEKSDKIKIKDSYLRQMGPYYAKVFGVSEHELLYYISFVIVAEQGVIWEILLLPLTLFPDFDPDCLKVMSVIEAAGSGKMLIADVYQDFQLVQATTEISKQLYLEVEAPVFKISNRFLVSTKQTIALEYRLQDALTTKYSVDFS